MNKALPEELKTVIKNIQNSARPGAQRAAEVKFLRAGYKTLVKIGGDADAQIAYLSAQARAIEALMFYVTNVTSAPQPEAVAAVEAETE